MEDNKMADVIDEALSDKKLSDLQSAKLKSAAVKALTKADVEKAIPLLKEVTKNNGHSAIAHKLGLTQQQVAKIHKKMMAKVNELTPREAIE
jgi:FixJ family two-component response regulator